MHNWIAVSGLLLLLIPVVAHGGRVEGRDLVGESLSNAIWHERLAAARGGDTIDLKLTLNHLDSAIQGLADQEERADTLEGIINAREAIAVSLAVQSRLIMGFSPLFPVLFSKDDLLVRNGSHEAYAVRRVVGEIGGIIPGFPIAKARTPMVIVSASGDSAAEAAARHSISSLSGLSTMRVIEHVTLAGILAPGELEELRHGDPELPLAQVLGSLKGNMPGFEGLHFLRIAPLESRERVTLATVEYGLYRDSGYEEMVRKFGFAESGAPGTAASILIILLMLPLQYAFIRFARRMDGDIHSVDPPPAWTGLLAAFVGYFTAWLGMKGISGMLPEPTTLILSLSGLKFLLMAGVALAILPMLIAVIGAMRLRPLSGKLVNPDTLGVLLLGALFGSFARIAELTLARFGWDWVGAPLVMGALSLLLLGGGGALGFARGLGRDRAWLAFGVIMLVGTGFAMVAALRMDLFAPILVTIAVVALAYGVRYVIVILERWRANPVSPTNRTSPGSSIIEGSFASRLYQPDLVLPGVLHNTVEQLVDRVVDDHEPKRGLRWIQIKGMRGAGKSRLQQELGARLVDILPGEPLLLSAGCAESSVGGTDVPYALFRIMLSEHLALERMASASSAMRDLQNSAAASTLKTAMRVAGLGPLSGLLDNVGKEENAEVATDHEIALSIAKKIESLSTGKALVVLLDDLHDIDEGSLIALGATFRRLETNGSGHVVVITTSNVGSTVPAELSKFMDRFASSVIEPIIDLETILPDISEAMQEGVLSCLGFDLISRQRLIEEMAARAIDYPADILRFVKTIHDAGLIEVSGQSSTLCRNADLSEIPSPTDTCSIVDTLTEGLSPQVVEVLRCAALLGYRFRPSILASIFGMELLTLLSELDSCSIRGIVVDIEDKDDYYEFADARTMALFREDVRRSMRRRTSTGMAIPQAVREYHRRYVKVAGDALVAEWDDLKVAPLEEISALASHARYLAESDPAVTVRWTLLHGQLCMERGMTSAAQRSLEHAWEAIDQPATQALPVQQKLEVAASLVDVMLRNGYKGDRLEHLVQRAEEWLGSGPLQEHFDQRVTWSLRGAEVAYRRRNFDQCGNYAEQVASDPNASMVQRARGKFLAAASLPLTDPVVRSQALTAMIREVENDLEGLAKSENRRILLRIKAEALNTLGMNVIHGENEAERAREIFQQALDINQGDDAPDRLGTRISLGGLGDSLKALCRFDEAEVRYRENLHESINEDELEGIVRMSSSIGSMLLDRYERSKGCDTGLLKEAESLYMLSLKNADRQENPIGQAYALAGIARHRKLARQATDGLILLIEGRIDGLQRNSAAFSILVEGLNKLKEQGTISEAELGKLKDIIGSGT